MKNSFLGHACKLLRTSVCNKPVEQELGPLTYYRVPGSKLEIESYRPRADDGGAHVPPENHTHERSPKGSWIGVRGGEGQTVKV